MKQLLCFLWLRYAQSLYVVACIQMVHFLQFASPMLINDCFHCHLRVKFSKKIFSDLRYFCVFRYFYRAFFVEINFCYYHVFLLYVGVRLQDCYFQRQVILLILIFTELFHLNCPGLILTFAVDFTTETVWLSRGFQIALEEPYFHLLHSNHRLFQYSRLLVLSGYYF